MLRKDHDSWKRVEGLMDHWEAWKQIPQVASEEYRISRRNEFNRVTFNPVYK